MRSIPVVVGDVLAEHAAEVAFAEQDHPADALSLDAQHPSLGERVHVRSLDGGAHDVDAGRGEDAVELLRERRRVVDHRESLPMKEPVDLIGEVARDLGHEARVRVRGDAGDLDPTCRVLDGEQHVVRYEPAPRPHVDREEVHAADRIGVRLQEGPPARRPVRAWLDAVVLERGRDGGLANAVAELLELALDAQVAPTGVLAGHANDQLPDHLHDAGAAKSLLVGVGVVRCDQPSVPPQDRVRGDDGCEAVEDAAAQRLALGREAAALVVRQAESLPAELLLQHAVLFGQVVYDLRLLPVDEAGECCE